MKRNLTIGILLFSILFTSCTNFFHNIIPPEEGVIIDFQLKYTNGSRSSSYTPDKNDNITIIVPAETDVTSLIPVVKISEKAQIVPGTLNYLNKIFPEKDLLTLALDMYTANKNGTFKTWFLNLVLENDGIKIPKLEMPIDFTTPVPFIVISGQGNYKFYTVTVKKESSSQDNNNNNDENQNDNNNDDSQEKDYENLILSFEVPSQIAESVIEHTVTGGNNEIIQDSNNLGDSVPYSGIVTFEVDENTNLKEILPIVTVSEGANLLPLTQNYLLSLGLSFEQILQFYSGYSTTSDVEKYIYSFIKKLDNITYPSLDMPINFYDTQVYFAVISANKDVKIYYINCKIKNIQPKLLNLAFSKTNNPLLIKDSKISIESQQITLSCLYPMDMELDYNLVADFVFDGDRVTYTMPTADEVEMISGVTKIPFTKNQRTCTITVYKSTKEVKYELVCPIELDPDSIRSITDFRFYKSKNTDIKKTVIASIYNEGDIGFISASVLYEGDVSPFELIPDFVTPGVVTKEGVEVISGNTCENFEYKTQYLCTSKNGLYCRLYDISIEFVQIVTEEPVITSFEFPVYLNKDLSKDAVATIDDLTNTIRCEILYFTEKPPYNLTPVFASNGEVTCNSITQTSGFSEESFKYTTYYVVTTGTEEKITKRYRVDVSFVKDSSSSCDILDFGFKIENNASLSSDVQATVTERTKSIFAFMPYGAGSQSGTLLTPTFTSNGTVSVNGQTQTSGISSQDFSSPVTYTVTSLNGLYTKEYVVSLQESGSIIYVDKNAVGRNNGTSWDDAFINLDTALEYVNTIDDAVLQEVWITADEYEPILNSKNGFNIRSNLILRGGFKGTESASNDRLVDSENCLENHTVLKRQPLNTDEESLFYANEKFTGTFTIDGFDIDLEQTANETFLDIIKVLNPIDVTENNSLEINNCLFNIKTQDSTCRFYYSEKDGKYLPSKSTRVTNNLTIENTKITGTNSYGFSILAHGGDVIIKNVKTNCLLNTYSNNYIIENCIINNEMFDIRNTNYTNSDELHFFFEAYLEMVNVIDRNAIVNIKNSYFNNIHISGYGATIENSTFEKSCIYSFYEDLNLINSNLDLIAINNSYGALSADNLIMKDSTLTAETVDTSYIIQVEDSEITVGKWIWDKESGSVLYEGNSFIKNSTIKSEGGNLTFSQCISKNNGIKPKDFYIENSIFIKCGYIGFGCENLTIKNSDFYMLEEDDGYSIVFDAKNLVLEGNDFDTTLIRTTENFITQHPFACIGTDDNVDFNNAEIKNNTFGNLCELAIYNGQDIDIEENYFGTGCFLFLGDNVSIKNNTFEDLEWISGGNILEYENNKVINKNSKRGYKYISATEFPYTEFNYENFCLFRSSGELVFNNCIFEPCTQTYSLPQGNFTFGNNYTLDFVSGYININNSTVNLGLSNEANLTINNCTAPNMKSISNSYNGVLSINDSTVTLSDSIVNYGKITVDECKTFNTDEITNNTPGLITINDSSVTANYINNNSASTEYEFNNVSCSFIKITNSGTFTMNDSTVINGNQIDDKGTLTINNSNINLTSTDGTNILQSTGNLSINGGTFNLKSTQGGNSLNAKGSLSINGGIFNFEHAGKYAPMFVGCDATISDAKFNFTGDEYTNSSCVAFENGTNGSTIKNCEFIIDKCAYTGFKADQVGLKIEDSKFDINVYPQNSGDTCYGFNALKDFSIDGGTYDLGRLSKSSSSNMSIKDATVSATVARLYLTENSVIDNSTVNLNCTDTYYEVVDNYSDYITNTKFNFSGLPDVSWSNYSSKLTNCYFNFSDVVCDNYYCAGVWLNTSCTIIGCIFEGFTNSSNITSDRGAAVRILNKSEDCNFIFENCIFKNNKVIGEYNQGGAALTGHPGNGFSTRILLKNCSFINNQNLSSHYTNEAAHIVIYPYDEGEMFLTLEGTNIMTGPSCPDILNGCTFLENEAVYIRTTSPITGTIN